MTLNIREYVNELSLINSIKLDLYDPLGPCCFRFKIKYKTQSENEF